MTQLRWLTSGESHGPALVGVMEGLPAGLPVDVADIDRDLWRRQQGYGRGGRMRIEQDRAEILAGVRFGRTLGSPVTLMIKNKDFWTERMQREAGGPDPKPVQVPRPGHADLAAGIKYGHLDDLRNVLERASARETATRVALGAVAKAFLRDLGIGVGSYVKSIGGVEADSAADVQPELWREDAESLGLLADQTETRALNTSSSERLAARILETMKKRDTVGGVLEVVATGLPVGLGSHVHWDRKLDGRLAQAAMAVQAIKAVEIGEGWRGGSLFGTELHDPIIMKNDGRMGRSRNFAGGLEGGVTNGEPLLLRAAMKPIATVSNALPSVELRKLTTKPAHVERSDTCAVPAAGVVLEAMVALVLADALLEALGADTMEGIRLPYARMRLAMRTTPGHIFLIGPMGAGKSSVGAALAKAQNRRFIDLDTAIEQHAGASVAQIFESKGEEAFRELERETLAAMSREPEAVIALGGGAPLNEAAWRRMRESGVVIALDASPEALALRILGQGGPVRPLLQDQDPVERLRALMHERKRWYDRADLRIATDGLSIDETVSAAINSLRLVQSPLAGRSDVSAT
ncbi:MAG: chorismate synthase [Hyphomonadaceae bacterium]|nr:chorismate synthase [Hyphomonadaceae bacterium]